MNIDNESIIRVVCFLSVFVVLAWLEIQYPRRQYQSPYKTRWLNNFLLLFIDIACVRMLSLLVPVSVAYWASMHHFGLLHWFEWGLWVEYLLGFLLLDFTLYWQHRFMHKWPILWRMHRVHHSDRMLDVSSGIRFHPAEIMVSLLIKIIIVVLAGVPVTVVILFEIVLNLTSLFNHSNLALPLWLDRVLRLFVVTPDMHRIHHSLEGEEQQRNYGFNLTWWDYIFSSYKPYPNQSQTEMVLGVHGFCERKESSFKGLMRQPLD